MIVPHSEFQLVANRRMRKRVLVLPVKFGPLGERRRPPRVGGVYDLKPASRYEEWKQRSRSEPTRARAVLWAIDRVLSEPKPIKVTVLAVDREGDTWLVRIAKGDESDFVNQDRSVYIGRSADYTVSASHSLDPDAPVMLVPGAAERARVVALAARSQPHHGAVSRATHEIEGLRDAMLTMKARNRVRLIQRELAKLQAELPSGQALHCKPDPPSDPALPANSQHVEAGSGPAASHPSCVSAA